MILEDAYIAQVYRICQSYLWWFADTKMIIKTKSPVPGGYCLLVVFHV